MSSQPASLPRSWTAHAWGAALAALVAWSAAGWGRTVHEFVRRPPIVPSYAMQWHLAPDSRPVRRLVNFLRRVDAALPPGSRLAVAVPVPADLPVDKLFLHQWISYLLPRQHVLPFWLPPADTADYWAAYDGAGPPPTGARQIARWGRHRLYRLERNGS